MNDLVDPLFIPCTLKELPSELQLEAAKTAIAYSPVNRPNLESISRLLDLLKKFFPGLFGASESILPPGHLALLTSRYWGSKGVKLGVAFLDNPPQSVRSRILLHMNSWREVAKGNVSFSEVALGNAEVRIARTRGQGYWSYLGTDIKHIPANQATMNLDSFSDSTSEAEYVRVVRHETGHTLGFPHEHMRRELVARLDEQKTIAYFGRTQGWDPQTVREQVLTPLQDADLTFLSPADQASIMCYQLPGSITIDGRPIVGGSDIDETDKLLIQKVYPLTDPGPQPPPPPPPPPPPVSNKLFTVTIPRTIRKGSPVSFRAPVNIPSGVYGWTPESSHAAVVVEEPK